MGFFDKYPNTDFHEINMDWILAKIQALKDRVKRVEDAVHDIVVETPNDGKLTIKRNNTIVGDFTANQATDEDINIIVPENTSDLNNDSDFITSSDLPDMNNYYDKTETDNLLSDKVDISSLATVATTGDYDDLINTPTIPAAQVNSDWNANSGVAQILNKPTIPAAQVNSDWDAISGVAQILNKPSLATVATSGNYNDLSNKPTIPSTTNDLINNSNFITYYNVTDGNVTSGRSILSILTNPNVPKGVSVWSTQNASDSPVLGNVSFAIISKHTDNGAYSFIWLFSNAGIFVSAVGSTIPAYLSFVQKV